MASRRRWLRRSGFIVGLAGVVVLIVWGLFNAEGGPSRYAIPGLMIYVPPFLIGVLIAWKWPLAGGIILGIIGLFWLVFIMVIVTTTPTSQAMLPLVFFMLLRDAPLILPPLASGILFILYWRAERAYLTRKKGCELR